MLMQRQLGSTDITVSLLGLGAVKFGRNEQVKYPAAFTLPTDQDLSMLLDIAQSLGINLIDTAPAYGSSEERLGKLLRGQRHDWVISTKVGEEFLNGQSHYNFNRTVIKTSIQRSLKLLHTDYLDIVLVHSNGEDEKIIQEYDVFAVLAELKQAGLIRAYGMSTKTIEGGLQTVAAADVVMLTHNLMYTAEQEVIRYARESGKGVFIKKAFASGHLPEAIGGDAIATALRFVLNESGVSSVVVGTINPEHLKQNASCVESITSC